jgi:hypothetical protein
MKKWQLEALSRKQYVIWRRIGEEGEIARTERNRRAGGE